MAEKNHPAGKANRNDEMVKLQLNLRRLFHELRYEPKVLNPSGSGKQHGLLETLLQKKEHGEYLRDINHQIVEAGRAANRMNQNMIELKRNQSGQNLEIVKAQEKMKQLELENQKMTNYMREIEKVQQDKLTMIRELIEMRNGMQMQLYYYMNKNSSKEQKAKEFISSYVVKLKQILEETGVEVIEDEGIYDSSCQTIWESIQTRNEVLHNHIAATIRSGYRYEGKILQIQEVVIYI